MSQYKQYAPVAVALLIGVILQALLLFMDRKETPSKAVIAFSKAYFMLNPCMTDWLCKEQKTVGDVNVVDYYLKRVSAEARERGFGLSYMKEKLYHIQTYTVQKNGKTAEVRITGERRFAMNPLYAIMGQLFGFTQAHEVDDTLTLIKEGKRWKVCGTPFQLMNEI